MKHLISTSLWFRDTHFALFLSLIEWKLSNFSSNYMHPYERKESIHWHSNCGATKKTHLFHRITWIHTSMFLLFHWIHFNHSSGDRDAMPSSDEYVASLTDIYLKTRYNFKFFSAVHLQGTSLKLIEIVQFANAINRNEKNAFLIKKRIYFWNLHSNPIHLYLKSVRSKVQCNQWTEWNVHVMIICVKEQLWFHLVEEWRDKKRNGKN